MPTWKKQLPLLEQIVEKATTEEEIKVACEAFKEVVVKQYTKENSRRLPMNNARKAVRAISPPQKVDKEPETVDFPYFYTDSGKGHIRRLEHLAIKYLKEDWNIKTPIATGPAVEVTEPVAIGSEAIAKKPETVTVDSLTVGDLGLSPEDAKEVEKALAHMSLADLIKRYVVIGARTVNAVNKHDVENMTNEELIGSKIKGASEELTKRAIEAIHAYNETYLGHGQRELCYCVTANAIKSLVGGRGNAISRVLEQYKELAEGYNYRHGLKPVQNRGRDIRQDIPGFKQPVPKLSNTTPIQVKKMPKTATGVEIVEYLANNPSHRVEISGAEQTLTYEQNEEGKVYCIETNEVIDFEPFIQFGGGKSGRRE